MADITSLSFAGDWRITVVSRNAGWSQRVSASGTAAGDVVVAGLPGTSIDISGNGQTPWTLGIEHNDGSSGWQPSWLRAVSSVSGVRLEFGIDSEDLTTDSSDRDFDDLRVRMEKLGVVSQPMPPFAIRPETMQAMPEAIFEATLGRYFMAVRITNIWTHPWPASARVGISDRCRAWLAAAGVHVVDAWSANEQATLGQSVVGGRVAAGSFAPWASRLIYFKVDVSAAQVRKHQVELQVHSDQGSENVALISRKAKAPICVSRTIYDRTRKAFVSRCDVGTMTAAIKEMVVDHTTLKAAMGKARQIVAGGSTPASGGMGGCDPQMLNRVREQLRTFLDGKDIDLCAVWRELACCCAGGPGRGDDDWTNYRDPIGFFVWPTVVDYSIDYHPSFAGQFGPFPYEDPWWKLLLLIILFILMAVSSILDLATHSDDVAIGILTGSIMSALSAQPATEPVSTDPGSIDAAVVTLNGNRSLTPAIFTTLDAQSGEFFTATPIVALDGKIDAPGTFLTNAQIDAIFQNLADNPDDPAAQAAVRAYKSGARSGLSLGRTTMSSLIPLSPRTNDNGVVEWFVNQIQFVQDADATDALACAGNSGSLWFQQDTRAVIALNHAGLANESGTLGIACRIEDVINQLKIRFA